MTPVVSDPAVDECVDPRTWHIVLKYNDGVVEVTRLPWASGRPIQSLSLGALS